jgi:ankyrin repeat protein
MTSAQITAQLVAKNQYGSTALHIAAARGRIDVIQALFNRMTPAQITVHLMATNKDGRTPLHIAAAYGNDNVTRVLLSNPIKLAQINAQLMAADKDGLTSLQLAVMYGKDNVTRVLLNGLIPPNQITAQLMATDKDGWTVLHIAVQFGYSLETIQALLKRNAKINALTRCGYAPLHLAVYQYPRYKPRTEVARSLCEALRTKNINIREILGNATLRKDDNGRTFSAWKTDILKKENAWYKQLLQRYDVNVDNL